MENQMPVVSVIIPTYNAMPYLESMIFGIIEQTFKNWELIIVDDRSTDNTVDIVNKYVQLDSRIKLMVRNRNPKGAQTCRNIGIEASKGSYIILFDADDLITPFCLQQRVEFMRDNSNIDYSTFKGVSFKEDKNNVIVYGKIWGINPERNILECFLEVQYPFGVWNNIYKSDIVKQIRFDEKIHIYQDFDFIISIILKSHTHMFAENSEIDYLYRQGHTGRITSKFITDEKIISTKYLFDKTLKNLQSHKDFKRLKKKFFEFHLLQYEKILIEGDLEQIDDFRKYINNKYHGFNRLRINISYKMIKKQFSKRSSKTVHLIIYSLFAPWKMVKWFYEKIKSRFK